MPIAAFRCLALKQQWQTNAGQPVDVWTGHNSWLGAVYCLIMDCFTAAMVPVHSRRIHWLEKLDQQWNREWIRTRNDEKLNCKGRIPHSRWSLQSHRDKRGGALNSQQKAEGTLISILVTVQTCLSCAWTNIKMTIYCFTQICEPDVLRENERERERGRLGVGSGGLNSLVSSSTQMTERPLWPLSTYRGCIWQQARL